MKKPDLAAKARSLPKRPVAKQRALLSEAMKAGSGPDGLGSVDDPLSQVIRRFDEWFISLDVEPGPTILAMMRRLDGDKDGKVGAAKARLKKQDLSDRDIEDAISRALLFSEANAWEPYDKKAQTARQRVAEIETVLRQIPQFPVHVPETGEEISEERRSFIDRSTPDLFDEARRVLSKLRDYWGWQEQHAIAGPLGIKAPLRVRNQPYVALRILRDTLFPATKAPHDALAWIIETAFDQEFKAEDITAALRRPRQSGDKKGKRG